MRMRRNFALSAGCAVLVAVVVAGVTVAVFPRDSKRVQLAPIPVPARPARLPPVSVRIHVGQIDTTVRATLARGGAATPAPAPGDVGQTGFRRTTVPSRPPSATHLVAKPAPLKRQVSIGADSGPNGDNGLAGTGSSSSSIGAQSSTGR
jgi:hypothetical protein